jgi:phosphatidylglycerophosphate synthase
VALRLKDLFDACDGALARLTGRGHLIGRYLDSLGDFLALTLVFGAIALRAAHESSAIYLVWGALAIASVFLQCSFFNYYQLAYLERFGIKTLSSRRNEADRNDLRQAAHSAPARLLLRLLRLLYHAVYGWQDRLVAAVDNALFKRCPGCSRKEWFAYRPLMVAQSALCFGTHIAVVIAFALFGEPHWSLIFVSTLMNIYLILLLCYRRRHFGGRPLTNSVTVRSKVTR